MKVYSKENIKLYQGDSLSFYSEWENPITIISDGPYGINGYEGDLLSHEGLATWYEKHIIEWSKRSTAETTLWFWNTEVGWASVHPVLIKHGWEYRSCHIWNKGIGHVAGNVNSKSIRKLPVVTEVCAQYVKKPLFPLNGEMVEMKKWLRNEWQRSGLPLNKTNEACGVKNAASRKYFTQCHLWYFPPPDAFDKLQVYANQNGRKDGRPFFSIDGKNPLSKEEWSKMRSKFNYVHGFSNVWDEPTVNGSERLRSGTKALHLNQKPLNLMELLVRLSSDEGDVIWEPFGGLCTASIAANKNLRKAYCSEISDLVYNQAISRIERDTTQLSLEF